LEMEEGNQKIRVHDPDEDSMTPFHSPLLETALSKFRQELLAQLVEAKIHGGNQVAFVIFAKGENVIYAKRRGSG